MKAVFKCLALLIILLSPSVAYAQSPSQDGNIPPSANFETFLKRDLRAYFAETKGQDIIVKYVFLRDGPTITGIALPKYYLWVRIYNSGKFVEEGAVRVAAVNGTQFEITDYLSKAAIVSSPDTVGDIFPAALVSKIKNMAGVR